MKYLKTYKIFESLQDEMTNTYYGIDVIKECDSIIVDIKDMLLELNDIGLFVMVGYTPMTLVYREKSPKIMIEVHGELEKCESNEDDINSSFERIKEYVTSFGFFTGFGHWANVTYHEAKTFKVYHMIVGKGNI